MQLMMRPCVRVCMEAFVRAWKRASTSTFAYARGWRIKTATKQKKQKQNKTFLARCVRILDIPKTLSKNTASEKRCCASLTFLFVGKCLLNARTFITLITLISADKNFRRTKFSAPSQIFDSLFRRNFVR